MIPVTISGTIVTGAKRGKSLGYPTANMSLSKAIVEDGIYISRVSIGGEALWHEAITFVGASKTFGETDKKAETYIFDFDQSIYGETLRVKLLKKIRPNQQFESVEDLVNQITKDVKQAREYFSNYSDTSEDGVAA